MVAAYQVRLLDVTGVTIAVFDTWRTLRYAHKLNDPGEFSFVVSGEDARCDLFEFDGGLEVWRVVPGAATWYREWAGLVEDMDDNVLDNGDHEFVVTGSKPLGLLGRREVWWYSGTPQADKSGVSETVIKEYVDENAGPGALLASGRWADGMTVGLSVEADLARGYGWDGARSGRNLLQTIQEIADYSELGFDVVETAARAWEFRVYEGQPGADRTTIGLDPATGLNGAGNTPIIFAPELGNVKSASFQRRRRGELNAVAVLGQGLASTRVVLIVEDVVSIGETPLNRREVSRSGTSQNPTLAELEQMGYEELTRAQYREQVNFRPMMTAAQFYGVHYFFGDSVTYRGRGADYNKRIIAVTATVEGSGESIELEFGDVL